MRFRRLIISNFRQFYGRHEIVIADGERLNTTVIFGNNGSGKTTLLNAFTWALYNDFTDAFSQEELLINKRAATECADGGTISCSVEVWYEQDGQEFRLVRESKTQVRSGQAFSNKKDSEVALYSMSGERKEQRLRSEGKEAENDISRILPKHLSNYFFFDGERIEKLVRSEKKDEVSAATRSLLGVETVLRGINDLKAAKTKLGQEMKAVGDADTQKKIEEREKCEKEQNELEETLRVLERELSNQKKLKVDINREFENLRESQALITRRKELIDLKNELSARVVDSEKSRELLISSKGYLAFMRDPVLKFRELLDGMRKRGELPAPIKSQFVRDLLEKGSCICGSALHSGSSKYEQVAHWLTVTPIADAEETALQMSARLDRAEDDIQGMWKELDASTSTIENARAQLSKIDAELEDINGKLRTDASQDIQKLQQRLDDTEDRITRESVRRADTKRKIDELIVVGNLLEDEIKKLRQNEGKAQLASRRWQMVADAISRMEELKARMGDQFRLQLENKIQKIFGQILTALYIPKLTEDYELILVERTTAGKDLPVPASTGESQVLSLSFIMAIIDCIRDWKEKKALLGIDSSAFPMVMDSPFGSLDELYRRQIAKNIPDFAHQLLLMVSKTQWRGEVDAELTPRLGRKYVLVYHTPKEDADLDDIIVDGKRFPLVQKSKQFEFTEIVEI